MLFSTVAQYFYKIEKESGRLVMTQLLAELLKTATANQAAIISNLSLGQLRPAYKGMQFNFAEKNIAHVLAQFLNISVEAVHEDAKRLGDLGLVVLQYDWKPADHVTLEQVYEQLVELESTTGTGSQEKKSALLLKLLQQLDPISAQYVIRIVLQTLRLGFSDMTLIDAFSWMAAGDKSLRTTIEQAYNVCVDIGFIVYLLKKEGIDALKKLKPMVGVPIRPAAAERLPSAHDIIEKIGPCIAQPKLDGFRLQIHVNKHKGHKEIHFFSRNLIDMSDMFPDLIKPVEQLDVEDVICEGEAIGYDPNAQSFLPFQETVKRKRKHDIEEVAKELPLQVFLFDILYLNGKDLMPLSTEERREHLLKIAKHTDKNIVGVIGEKKVKTAQALQDYFLECIEAGLEGLVVKKPDAPYQPGKRNFNWIKLKRHAESHLEDTIDTVILGYYAGSGKRTQFGIGAFLVGVYNKRKDAFETLARVGTGLTDEQWKDLKKRCDKHAVKEKPKNVICAQELYPDVWVAPEMVCQIFADEITESPMHTAGKTETHLGYALRFPRFMGYREDKSPEQATDITEIKSLFEAQKRA